MNGGTVKLAPSILAADFARLGEQAAQAEQAGADPIHPTTLPNIRHVRHLVQQIKPGSDVEVDGGIDAITAPLAVRAGANVLVAGTSIFAESDGVAAAMGRLRTAVNQGSQLPLAV